MIQYIKYQNNQVKEDKIRPTLNGSEEQHLMGVFQFCSTDIKEQVKRFYDEPFCKVAHFKFDDHCIVLIKS